MTISEMFVVLAHFVTPGLLMSSLFTLLLIYLYLPLCIVDSHIYRSSLDVVGVIC